jgi:hypothetical protein
MCQRPACFGFKRNHDSRTRFACGGPISDYLCDTPTYDIWIVMRERIPSVTDLNADAGRDPERS